MYCLIMYNTFISRPCTQFSGGVLAFTANLINLSELLMNPTIPTRASRTASCGRRHRIIVDIKFQRGRLRRILNFSSRRRWS